MNDWIPRPPPITLPRFFALTIQMCIRDSVKTKSISQQQYFNPFDFFFGFGDRTPSQPREQVGFGSGVIISKDGYIITNNHVVERATEVSVTLNDNREFVAKVVGTDTQSDIALLKIEGEAFPYLTFGNSDALEAVSYTHLDVYKRQVYYHGAR